MEDNSDKNQVVTNEDQSTQNEYISIINKKIRALKKKCQNIANIKEKITAKVAINPDQQKLLASQDQVIRSLNEFEAIRNQFVEIYNNEQKVVPKEKPKQVHENKNEGNDAIRSVVTLLHVTQIFDRTRAEGIEARKAFFTEASSKPSLIKDDADIDSVFYIMHSLFRTPIAAAIDYGQKFAFENETEFAPNMTYKHLKAIVTELSSSYIFKGISSGSQEQKNEEQSQDQSNVQEEQQQEVAPEHQEAITEQHEEQSQVQPEHVEEQVAQAENGEHHVETEQDEGYQTTERKGRGGRGRGRGGRGQRGGNFGQRDYDANRGGQRGGRGRGRDFDRGSPREGRKFERGSPRGGQRDYDGNNRGGQRGGRGRDFDRQPQQQKV